MNIHVDNIIGDINIDYNNTKYRYYKCKQYADSLKCKQIQFKNDFLIDESTQIISIKKTIPEYLDKMILKYKWIPNSVIIE